MTEEEIGLLHTLSKMPDYAWAEFSHVVKYTCVETLKYKGFIRVTQLREQNRHVCQLTEAGRFYVRSTPEGTTPE